MHHDSSNSDTAAAPGFDDFDLAYQGLDGWRTIAIPAVADGRVYLTVGKEGETCHLAALDSADGELIWCSDAVNGTAFGSTPVVDIEGNLYVGDDTSMVSLTRGGEVRWRVPVDGLPISAQITNDGNLLFASHVGRVTVLDRMTGSELASHELVPGLTYDGAWATLSSCPQGQASGECPSANTPAVDPVSGRVFLTLNRPGDADGTLVALQYRGGKDPMLSPLWESPVLDGGGAASPTISADGTRVYTTDRNEKLYAFDSDTGEVIWVHPIGYTAGGSPSVGETGAIVPAGGRDGMLMGLRDGGDRAEVMWEHADIVHRGLAVQPEGSLVYSAVVIDLIVHLAVVDLSTGEILDLESTQSGVGASMGSAIGPDGSVYLTTPLNGVFAFMPAQAS